MRWKKDWGTYDWGQILTNYEHTCVDDLLGFSCSFI